MQLCDQSFQQKCQGWMVLLEKLESGLPNGISGNDSSMREQLAVHQVRCLFLLYLFFFSQGTLCSLQCPNGIVSGFDPDYSLIQYLATQECNYTSPWLQKSVKF